MSTLRISLQLYTLRKLTDADFANTLSDVAKIGYKYVELAGFGSLSTAAGVRRALDDVGLKLSGAHVPIDLLEKNLNQILDEQDALDNKQMIVPWLNVQRRKDAAGWRQFGVSLGNIPRAVQSRGFEIAYHNHDFEFQTFEGRPALDILFEADTSGLVKSELDVYWVKSGGYDPVDYIHKLGKRVSFLHLKDMAPDQKFAPVGTGTLDFPAIIKAAESVGAKFGVVEQDDTYDQPPLEAVRVSLDNLKRMGLEG